MTVTAADREITPAAAPLPPLSSGSEDTDGSNAFGGRHVFVEGNSKCYPRPVVLDTPGRVETRDADIKSG